MASSVSLRFKDDQTSSAFQKWWRKSGRKVFEQTCKLDEDNGFKRALAKLTEMRPPAFPVKVKRVRPRKEWRKFFGQARLMKPRGKEPYFLIEIADFSGFGWIGDQIMADSLVHEWSHCLSWNFQHEHSELDEWHPDDWGPFFAQAYRAAYYKTK